MSPRLHLNNSRPLRYNISTHFYYIIGKQRVAVKRHLHLWHPYQQKPATDWEARCDFLYNEGSYTSDKASAQKIWDEYQRLILEECPIIYLVRPASFFAIRNRWNLSNFYYDNLNGAKTKWVWLDN